jgi:hypothetical protein
MRFIFLCIAFLGMVKAYPAEGLSFTRISPFFAYSVECQLKKGEQPDGKVVRTGLCCPRYYYDLFDEEGLFRARAITRVFSLGMLVSPSALEMDLYDETEQWIGSIEGQVFVDARASYLFYNAERRLTGIAYLDSESADFLILSPEDQGRNPLAIYKGKLFGEFSSWKMKVLDDSLEIDERLLKIFGGFIADYHTSFIPYNCVNIFIYNNYHQ